MSTTPEGSRAAAEPEGHPTGSGATPASGRLAQLAAAVDQLVTAPIDTLDHPALQEELGAVETEVRRLSARQTRIVAAMTARRAAETATRKGTDPGRERQQATREIQQELTDKQQWTPSKAKATGKLGRRLGERPELAAAFDRGQLPTRNAELLDDLLDKLAEEHRPRALELLLPDAASQNAVAFGRTCRRLLAELDHDSAMAEQAQQHAQRRAAIVQRPDGTSAFHGQWSGVDAEVVHTALDAFRTMDGPGLRRTPEQRTADAFIELCRAALRQGKAPARHGIRPHILITVSQETLTEGTGTGEGAWTGPLPVGEIRRLLDDASIARVVIDAKGLPLEASEQVRTVPAALYRALVVRDGGCVAESCDAPAAWCDVMHLETAFRHRGRLHPGNAALGCRRHHRAYDLGGWELTRLDGRPVLRPPPS